MKNLIKTIQNTIFQHGLFERGSKIVVGVSGGPDSVCLLDVLSKLAPKYDLELTVAHVNYGLRGKDSDKDELFVESLAEKYGLQFSVMMPVLQKNSASENKLREMRYQFFEDVRTENDFDLIAVAHNADDQVETFLMRVMRGSGLQGLSAMKFKTEKIIRPLLGISRKEILEYLKNNNLTYRTDRTNRENLFLRNKIRNKLIPYLEKNFNPAIKETIFGATTSIAEDYDFLNSYAEALLGKQKELSIKKLLTLHPALQRRVLLLYIGRERSDLKDIEASHIEEVLKALRSTKSKNQVVVFKGLKLTRKGDKVILSRIA
ncbi:MAG: tRNA lysidine(34) synthetase TilS [Parcubacteria group bacterium]|jgi:tRNA(Ile)-lysidine synthase